MDYLTSSFHTDFLNYSNTINDQQSSQELVKVETCTFSENLIDFQCTLAGRESFSTEGRDSLGILQNFAALDIPKVILEPLEEVRIDDRESLDVRRNSLFGDMGLMEDIRGRESLGLLKNGLLEDRRNSLLWNCLDAPASVSTNLLNTGFRHLSATSSVSSICSSFRPSSWSLNSESEELSKIFSINSKEYNTNSLNKAFIDSNKENIYKSEEIENCPEKKTLEIEELNDTVFLESRIIAAEIENGSFLNETPDVLFTTDSPLFVDLLFDEADEIPTKLDIDTILKHSEGSFPKENVEDFSKNVETVPIKTTDINNCQVLEVSPGNNDYVLLNCDNSAENCPVNNLLSVNVTDKLNTSISPKFSINRSRNSSKSRSRDAKDLINNLSSIVNADTIENQSEVKKILQNLADVLLVPNRESNDDSGHSSLIEDHSLDENVFLDAPKAVEKVENRMSRSFFAAKTIGNEENIDVQVEKSRKKSLEDFKTNKIAANVKKMSVPSVKFIPKKHEVVKKGPMKAVVPLANMKKRCVVLSKKVGTPEKCNSFEKFACLKRRTTSTPKMWNNAPVAQSTPEEPNRPGSSSNLEKSLRYSGGNNPFSPHSSKSSLNNSAKRTSDVLNRSTSASAPNINRSESPSRIPSLAVLVAESPTKSSHNLISRRRSVSEIKYGGTTATSGTGVYSRFAKSPLARFSAGGDAATQQVVKPPTIRSAASESDVKSEGNRNRSLLQYVTPMNLLNKMKK